MISSYCPSCGATLRHSEAQIGQQEKCPSCGTRLVVTAAGAVTVTRWETDRAAPRAQGPTPSAAGSVAKEIKGEAPKQSQQSEALASDQWYYTQNGNQRYGPVPFSTLQQLAKSGKLKLTDMVWRHGMSSWTPASDVTGLFVLPQHAIEDDEVALGGE